MGLPTIEIAGNVKFKEIKDVNGKSVCSFVLSCSEKKYKGEGYDNFDVKVTVWEKSADFVNKYFQDGDVAVVTGKLITKVFEKQDGTKVRTTEFHFPQVSFPPKSFNKGTKSPVIHETIKRPEPLEAEELPF